MSEHVGRKSLATYTNNSSTSSRVDDSSITRSADPSPSMTTPTLQGLELSRQMQIAWAYADRPRSAVPSSSATSFPTASSKSRHDGLDVRGHGFEVLTSRAFASITHSRCATGSPTWRSVRRGRRGGRRRACPRLASLHVGFGLRLRTTPPRNPPDTLCQAVNVKAAGS